MSYDGRLEQTDHNRLLDGDKFDTLQARSDETLLPVHFRATTQAQAQTRFKKLLKTFLFAEFL